MENKILKDWIKFLDEDEVKFQLICSSLYMTAYELLIDVIVKKLIDFYCEGIEDNEPIISENYKTRVKTLFKGDIVIASSFWLRDRHVITDLEVERIKEFKIHRNDIAHELPKIISDSEYDVRVEHFTEIQELYRKIHLWWFLEVELPTDPDFESIDFDRLDNDEALSLVMLPMTYMVNIVNDEVKKRMERKMQTK